MPKPPSTKAHWSLKQTLAWVADRNLDRIDKAHKEWRDRYYGYPHLPDDWRDKDPLIWDWRSPVDELKGAAQALQRECVNGALRATGREGGAPRCEIALLWWPDLMLVDIAGTTDGPQLYDGNANLLAITDRRVEPVFHGVLFDVADVVKAFPAAFTEQTADAPEPVPSGADGAEAEADLPPLWRDVKAGLLRLYPVKKEARATYEILGERLREEEGIVVSRATLAQVIQLMPSSWRGKRRGKPTVKD